MSIYQRNGNWYIYIVHNGKRIRQSADTTDRKAAQELHDKLKHELWRVDNIGDKPKHTWDEACLRWLKEKAHKKSLDDDKAKILLLQGFLGKYLLELNRDYITKTVDNLDVSPSTKNRYISLIRAILKKCAGEWEWLDKAPPLTSYKEPKKRIRWLTEFEAARLLQSLPQPISDMAHFSLLTGLRQSNVLYLEWEQVDLIRKVAWIYADQAKGGRPIGVPLNASALEILNRQKGKHRQFVFVRKDKAVPYNGISSKTWANALKKVGIVDFRWHDLRHTWASWLVQSGVPLLELQEMGGWESVEMVQKYAHLSSEHLHKNAVFVDRLRVACEKSYATSTPQRKNALVSNLDGLN